MHFQKIHRLKKIQTYSDIQKKRYSHYIEILQAKGHFYYLNGEYPFSLKMHKKFISFNTVKSVFVDLKKKKLRQKIRGENGDIWKYAGPVFP